MKGPKLKPKHILNRIEMARMGNKYRSFVMVEGPNDKRFWSDYVPDHRCKLQRVCGKPDVTRLLESNMLREIPGVSGLVDADFWLITDSHELDRDNLLYDRCYPDAELMILDSAALTEVLKTKFHIDDDPDIQKLADLLKSEAERLAMEFGYFRLLNECKCYGINFKCFWDSRSYDFDEFVDAEDIDSIQFRRDCFAIRLAKFHNAGRKRGQDQWIEHGELLAGVAELKKNDKYKTPNIQLCQGHETVAIIAYLLPIMFKSVFGDDMTSHFKEFRDRLKLEKKLRNKYKEEYFITTTLCDAIKNWECCNNPYKILKPEI